MTAVTDNVSWEAALLAELKQQSVPLPPPMPHAPKPTNISDDELATAFDALDAVTFGTPDWCLISMFRLVVNRWALANNQPLFLTEGKAKAFLRYAGYEVRGYRSRPYVYGLWTLDESNATP